MVTQSRGQGLHKIDGYTSQKIRKLEGHTRRQVDWQQLEMAYAVGSHFGKFGILPGSKR